LAGDLVALAVVALDSVVAGHRSGAGSTAGPFGWLWLWH
jgi:hypothetical protein